MAGYLNPLYWRNEDGEMLYSPPTSISEYLDRIKEIMVERSKVDFVSISDMYEMLFRALGLGSPYSCSFENNNHGWITDSDNNTHYVFRTLAMPSNKEFYKDDIVAEDRAFLYVEVNPEELYNEQSEK